MIKVEDLTVYHVLPGGLYPDLKFFITHKAVDKDVDLGNVTDITEPFDKTSDPAFWDKLGDWVIEHYDELIERYFPETLNWMSQEEFVNRGGCCPVCGSVHILWDDEASDFDVSVKSCWCQDCPAFFMAHYHLVGYSDVQTGEPAEENDDLDDDE